MRLLYDGPVGIREVSITGGRVATVGELADALGLPPATAGLWVQDQWAATDDGLDEAGVVDGTRVGVRPGLGPDEPGWTVEAVGGLCAGDRCPLGSQGAVVGRSPEADLTLPNVGLRPQHARVQSRDGGVWLQIGDRDPVVVEASAPLRLGRALIQTSHSPDDRPHRLAVILGRTTSGRIAFNRPPRPAPPDPPEPLPTPADEPARSSRAMAFGWAALVAPLVAGLLMAVLYSPYMALFALLSPLMMGATWFDNRRRDRSERRRSRRRSQTSLAVFAEAAAAAHATEVRRRRDQCPHLAEAVRRVRQPSVRLWERRPGHDDFMVLVAAHGPRPFTPELAVDGPQPAAEATASLEQLGPLLDVPILVELGPGKLVGLVGPRTATTAIARALVLQTAAHHGPADVAVLVAADEVTAPGWAWTAWLPHTAHPALGGRQRLIADHREAVAGHAADLAEAWQQRGDGTWPLLLAVVDGDNLATGRKPPARPLLLGTAGPVAALVLASSVDQLPAAATAVIEARDLSGSVDITLSRSGETMESVLATGMSLSLARDTARRLARFEDPELPGTDSGIPERSSLIDLLDLLPPDGSTDPHGPADPDAEADPLRPANPEALAGWSALAKVDSTAFADAGSSALADAMAVGWERAAGADSLVVPIGADGHGSLMADLVADGPHALVGGTTGSGKSELLRTLVASLAATYSPEHVNFVLVDYKGGSAFDACASLPHVVGLVTDLDGRLAERALRCLEAELRRREQTLRDRGATDLTHYRTLSRTDGASSGGEQRWPPLPRLVVVIDEFAALAGELPGFMDSLVNVAQRGRSLGMHLVLATQRPAGAVSANIRTNTALRIALRMLDATDSVDILDSPEAAAIGRDQPGRAYARFGPGELVEFQAALVTGATAARGGLRVVPAPDGLPAPEPEAAPDDGDDVPGDLARLAQAAVEAWGRWDGVPPRQPWPDPLPLIVSLDELATHDHTGDDPMSSAGAVPEPEATGNGSKNIVSAGSDTEATGDRTTSSVAFALADDPNRQCQYPMVWNPGQGSILFAGSPGSGTTTALGSLAIALARSHPPDACHLYVIDFGSGQLSPLDGLPHCGAVVGADEPDRLRRLIRRLEAELDRRTSRGRTPSASEQSPPLVVTLVANWGGLAKALDNVTDHAMLAALERVWAEGPAVGLCLAAAADQLSKVNRSLQAATPQTYVFRLGDPALYRQWGVAVDDPTTLPPGRGFAIPSGIELQVAVPNDSLAAAINQTAATHSPTGSPPPVESLPSMVDPVRLNPARLNASPVYLPLGLSDDTLAPVGFTLYPKEHALILGPPRSGRTSALALLAAVAASADAQVIALAPEGSPLNHCPHIHLVTSDPDELSRAATATNLPTLALIDDAETIPDPDSTLKALATDTRPGLHIIAAGRPDRLRTAYGHWTAEIRFSRTGVLLQPTPLDGDLFNLQLPTRPTLPQTPGRGYLIQNTTPTILQIAHYGDQAETELYGR